MHTRRPFTHPPKLLSSQSSVHRPPYPAEYDRQDEGRRRTSEHRALELYQEHCDEGEDEDERGLTRDRVGQPGAEGCEEDEHDPSRERHA